MEMFAVYVSNEKQMSVLPSEFCAVDVLIGLKTLME